jgi:hypothetical protein
MTRIATVSLAGYKGLTRDYQLDGPTILSGRNGAGKSAALEGLRYALRGRVPSGLALDAVASYFPPRGGTVTVRDSTGRWITRGIRIDHAKKKVSEILTTSDTNPDVVGGAVDLSAWQVSEIVLDVAEFIALSAAKRREFILRLCGGGEVPEDLIASLEAEYAKEIGGPGATPAFLHYEMPEISAELAAMAKAWWRLRGLRDVLGSFLGAAAAGKSLSDIFLRLGEAAKESMLGSRKAAREAAAAQKELEAGVQGARAAAATIDAKRAALEKIREELSSYRARVERRDEAHRRLDAAREARERAEQARRDADSPNAAPPPGERPIPPAQDPRRAECLAELNHIEHEAEQLRRAIREFDRLLEAENDSGQKKVKAEDAFQRHERLPLRRVTLLLEEIPDEADPSMPELREAVRELAAGFNRETVELERQAEAAIPVHEAAREAAKGAEEGRNAARAKLHDLMEVSNRAARERLAKAEEEAKGGEADYRKRLATWDAADRAHRAAETSRAAASRALETAERGEAEARKRLAAVETVNGEAFPNLEIIEAKLYSAEAEAQAAEEAAGAVKAYEEAGARAAAAQVDEAAWKAAGQAIGVLRERVIGSSTAGLIDDIARVLRAAGRPEVPYLELETDRGRPAFDLGWTRGEVRTSITALSAGEAVLFLSALSVALTRRSPGRRLLLIEADPLDTGNLEALLRALAPVADELEACVVATAAEGWTAPEGWRVVKLGDGA